MRPFLAETPTPASSSSFIELGNESNLKKKKKKQFFYKPGYDKMNYYFTFEDKLEHKWSLR